MAPLTFNPLNTNRLATHGVVGGGAAAKAPVNGNAAQNGAAPKESFVKSGGNDASQDLWNTARNRFGGWDKDRNGHLTNAEIETALKTKNLSANDKATLETLRGRQGELQKASNDEWGFESKGTSLKDLEAFRTAGDGEAKRLEEQFSIEKSLIGESQGVKDKALANKDRPATLADKVGTRDYYIDRYKDFRRRNPDEKAPDYYLNYGLKYFDRFHAQKGGLQEASQKWVDRTGVALQQNMETRNANPADFAALERNPEKFKSFAYGSHPSAYLDSGLQTVSYGDRIKIGMTPDASDLLTMDGVKQAVHTGGVVVAQDVRNGAVAAGNWIGDQASSAAKWVGGLF